MALLRLPRRRRDRAMAAVGAMVALLLVALGVAWRRGWLEPEYLASARDDLRGCGDVDWTATPRTPDEPLATLEPVVAVDEPLTGAVPHPDGERLLVLTESGRVLLADRERGTTEVVLDLSDRVSVERDRGLLGMTLDEGRGVAYLLLTDADGDSRLESHELVDGLPTGEHRLLLEVEQDDEHHNGGGLALDADGDLWVALGDGGLVGDRRGRAQDLDELLGKLLRITPTPEAPEPYVVPDDNPFVGHDHVRPEIFASGLRNPFRIDLDVDGSLWIADVGNLCVEELSRLSVEDAGANLGWNRYEGTRRFVGDALDDHHGPVFEYPHDDGWCAIVAGTRYAGRSLPDLEDTVIVADFCSSRLLAVATDGRSATDLGVEGAGGTVAVVPDHDGELLVVSYGGTVSRLVPPRSAS